MQNQHIRKILSCILIFVCVVAYAAEFSVPFSAKNPVVDGKFSVGEWDNALVISGAGNIIDARKTEFRLTWSNDCLYGAFRTETPPRGKLIRSTRANPVYDDSVELWFVPPKELRTNEQYKFGEFQIIIGNGGKILLQHHNPGYGLSARKWDAKDIKFVNDIQNNQWICEFSIPAKAFGFDKFENSDWKILSCVNFRSAPVKQIPFIPVASFMDIGSFPTFKFHKDAPNVRQIYENDSTRSPLKFESSKKLAYEIIVNDKKSSGTLPVTLQAPENSSFTVKINDNGNIVFSRTFQTDKLPERIWNTPESYIVLEQDFEEGADKFITAPKNAAIASAKLPPLIQGRNENSKALHFKGDTKSLRIKRGKLPVPGNISFWLHKDAGIKSGYIRYFGTAYSKNGYIGLQDQKSFMLLFLHGFNKKNKNIRISRRPAAKTWTHISLNFTPKRVEVFCNGIKVAENDLPFEVNPEKLGDLVFGGSEGFAIDDYVVYSRALSAGEIKAMAQGETSITGEMSWYPSLNSIVLDLACDSKIIKNKNIVLHAVSRKGKSVYSGKISLKNAKKIFSGGKELIIIHEAVKLPEKIADGNYIMSITPEGSETVLIEKEFKAATYKWQNNKIGMRDILLPGFTPLQVKSNVISCVLRDYTIGRNGLPEKIIADKKQILAAPVTVNFVKNGKITSADGSAEVKPVKVSDTAVTYTAAAKNMQVKGKMEQDGLLILDLNFPAELDADRVYVDIPVKKEFATLYHPVSSTIRTNPAGFTPKGSGTVFKSRNVQQVRISNFIPYLFLGTDTRGICYAANWDKDWVHCKERDAVELFRHRNGDVSIRLNIINAPVKFKRERTVTIALQASPVKPMPQGWRGWADGFNYRGNQNSAALLSPPYWGSYRSWSSRYPAFEDFEYIRKLASCIETGKIDTGFKNEWIQRLLNCKTSDAHSILKKKKSARKNYVSSHTNAAFATAKRLHGKKNPILYFYTCDAETAAALPEYSAMQGEWGLNSYGVGGSYSDYALYYFDKMLEAGMRGIYNDNTFFRANYSWVTNNAYIDDNGEIKPGFNLWNNREYRRRLAVAMIDRGITPWITVHHTNANILPTLSFATNSMGMEWKYGTHDFQKRFTPDYIRTVCQGLQCGLYPTALDGVTGGTKEQRYRATRTMLAALMPHEIRPTAPRGGNAELIENSYNYLYDFGIWQDDCKYTAYWDSENPVKSSEPDLLVSTYLRGKKLLLVCGSFTEDINAELTCKYKIKSAKNLELGTALNVSGNEITFPLKKHDFILIEAEIQ